MQATAYSAASGPRGSATLSSVIREFSAALLCVLLFFASLLLLARRWAGALNEPLPFIALAGVGIAATMTAEAIRLLNRRFDRISAKWLVRLALPILALAISLPGSSALGLLVLWLIVVGEELRLWRTRAQPQTSDASRRLSPARTRGVAERPALTELPPGAVRHDPNITQHISYRNTTEGSAVIEGWLRADFTAGQRTAIVHVAFCPPFVGTPQVEIEPIEGPACDIRATLVLPWGVRWECKLEEQATQPMSVVLEFFVAEGQPKQR